VNIGLARRVVAQLVGDGEPAAYVARVLIDDDDAVRNGKDRGKVGGHVPLDDPQAEPATQALQVDRNAAAG